MLLFSLPAVLCLALGVQLAGRMNGVDEFIYVGAVERLNDFVHRWPDTYYAVRFGYLVPEWLFARVFGADLGYLVLRFAILGVIATTMRLRGIMRLLPSVFGTLILVTSPIVLGAAFNTYVASLGTLFALLGAALLACGSATTPRSAIRVFIGGAALALAWNSHFAFLPICAIIMTVFAVDELAASRRSDRLRRVWLTTCVGLGSFATILIGVAVYRWQFQVSDVFGPTFRQAKQDTNPVFIGSSTDWLAWRHYLLLGPLAVVVGAITWTTELDQQRRMVARRLTAMTFLSLAAFAWFEWVRNDPLLSIFYYSCLPLALGVLTLAFSLMIVTSRMAPTQQPKFVAVAAISLLSVLHFASVLKPSYVIVVLGALVVAAFAILGARGLPHWQFISLAIALLASSWFTVSSPHDFAGANGAFRVDPYYDHILFEYDLTGIDQLRVAREFAQSLPTLPANRGEIRVWFDSTGSMNQVISTLVWYRSALQRETDPPMPALSQVVTDRVTLDRPRYVVVLDDQATDVVSGVEKIQKLAPYRIVWVKVFQHGPWTANATLLERTDGAWPDFPCLGPAGNSVLC